MRKRATARHPLSFLTYFLVTNVPKWNGINSESYNFILFKPRFTHPLSYNGDEIDDVQDKKGIKNKVFTSKPTQRVYGVECKNNTHFYNKIKTSKKLQADHFWSCLLDLL